MFITKIYSVKGGKIPDFRKNKKSSGEAQNDQLSVKSQHAGGYFEKWQNFLLNTVLYISYVYS